ncbi:MAG: histidine kinase [Chitinophagaceae bacterium]|nr:histidine kinase [Chitinophagaceae bacterium]
MKWVSKYSIIQLLGWACYGLLNIYISFFVGNFSTQSILINILIALGGLFITHFYRYFLIRYDFFSFTTEKLTLSIAGSSLVLAIIFVIYYHILIAILFPAIFAKQHILEVLSALIAAFFIFLLWNAFYFFWNYMEKNRQTLISKLKLDSEKKDLELKAIKSNLQPHFIFNSLNSIRALVNENPETARDAITKLSKILRSSINSNETLVPLETELQLVNDYITLEKIRFEEKLNFSTQIDNESLSILFPPLLLQTLIENAVKHGISKLEKGGEIKLISSVENNFLTIDIWNDGKGLASTTSYENTGFGVESTKKRLYLFYGEKSSFNIKEEKNKIHVTLKIPLHKK